MIYIYDILLNFTEGVPYEFFEWEEEDITSHVKKIPLYKVPRTLLKDVMYGNITVSASFLEEIKKKTELYQKGLIEKVPYVCLFTDGTIALAVSFNEKGTSHFKSRLLLDEEEEVLEFSYDLKEVTIPYTFIKEESFSPFETRLERKMKHFLKVEFQNALQEENVEKIKYFYEECFEKEVLEEERAGEEILESLNHFSTAHKKLYQILKRSYEHRKEISS